MLLLWLAAASLIKLAKVPVNCTLAQSCTLTKIPTRLSGLLVLGVIYSKVVALKADTYVLKCNHFAIVDVFKVMQKAFAVYSFWRSAAIHV